MIKKKQQKKQKKKNKKKTETSVNSTVEENSIARRLVIAKIRENYYCKTSASAKNSVFCC